MRRGDKLPESSRVFCTLLLVEDEEPCRRALTQLLAAKGFVVWAVSSAEEAIEVLRERCGDPPTYMVVDVDLPGMCGLDLVRYVQQAVPRTRPMLLTAADSRMVQSFCQENEVDYFPKPLDVSQFLDHIGCQGPNHRRIPPGLPAIDFPSTSADASAAQGSGSGSWLAAPPRRAGGTHSR